MPETHEFKSLTAKISDSGVVEAEFSVFDVVDRDGDIVTSAALQPHNGKEIPMVWAHDWEQPVGKGRLVVSDRSAVFAGEFLKTARGTEAYETVKQMGSLQQWSWGFRVLDDAWEKRDGKSIRLIKSVEPFEVSPVLVGSNPYTSTLAVKGRDRIADLEEEIRALKARLNNRDLVRLAEMQAWLKEER